MSNLDRGLLDLAQALERDETSAVRVTEQALERHGRFGEDLRAYKTFDPGLALAQARAVDERRRVGDRRPLDGVPVSVKDLYGVEGFPTFAGTSRRLPERWEREGFLVQTLRAQGAIIVGKSHTVELAFGGVGTNPHWGSPVNPWDRSAERVAGGSSCGAGVSLAEGSALIALGTDTGGSIRIPAALTGVVGHKLTRGRWATDGVFPLSGTLDTVGALTRSLSDQAFFFGAVDPYGGGAADLGQELARPDGVRSLRIGVPATALWGNAERGVTDGVQGALSELERAGATLVPLPGDVFDEASQAYFESAIVAVECAAVLDHWLPEWWPLLHRTVGTRVAPGREVLAARYVNALADRLGRAEAAQAWLAEVDVAALPTVPITAPTQEEVQDLPRYVEVNRSCLSGTTPASYLDLCALTLPVALDGAGLPVALQLLGPGGQDEALLSAGLAIERVLGSAAQRLGIPARTT